MAGDVKLEMQIREFERNVQKFRRENDEEINKTLVSGAAAYATTAAKCTPPDVGKSTPGAQWYADGVDYDRSGARGSYGRRRVYDLLALARNPDTGHYRKMYGKMLRQGYFYAVSIRRNRPGTGTRVKLIPCRTKEEAVAYAHETYRGFTRAAWGLSFTSIAGKMPPSFSKLISRRPSIPQRSQYSTARFDRNAHEITLANNAINMSGSFIQSMDAKATYSAVRTMNDRMTKFFNQKREL